VWQKAKSLAVRVYQSTEQFPRTETYGLTAGEFQHFLGQARGSLLELETQLDIALDLRYLNTKQLECLMQESYQVLGLLNRLIQSLRRKPA